MRKLEAFSLVELSISILIIGIIIISVFKGGQLIETAKVQSVARQFQEIRSYIESYLEKEGCYPGLGDGARYAGQDLTTWWREMYDKGIVASESPIMPRIGGRFVLQTVENSHYISIADNGGAGGAVSGKQAKVIKFLLTGSLSDKSKEGEMLVQGEDGSIQDAKKYIVSYRFSD